MGSFIEITASLESGWGSSCRVQNEFAAKDKPFSGMIRAAAMVPVAFIANSSGPGLLPCGMFLSPMTSTRYDSLRMRTPRS